MEKNEDFIKKIGVCLKKDIDDFIKGVSVEFSANPFTIYGLNISVYLLKNERNRNNEEVYEVYSLDCSQNLPYYNSIWNKYLENHSNRFSHFDFNGHTDRGWYEKDVSFKDGKKKLKYFKDLTHLTKVDAIVLSEVVKEEKPNNDIHFVNVEDGWIKFINELDIYDIKREFNLSWVSSYIHIPNSEYLEYPKWYISCYLLMDIADKINDRRFYKKAIRPAINKLLFNSSLSFHELLIEDKQNDIEKHATRAAISQVMARNTSHNIGAHVMNKLIGDNLGDVDVDKFENYDKSIVLSKDNKNIFGQIAIFNNYVKCRMDYLADISFGIPQMQTNKYVYQDIFKELDKVRLLVEYISGLSGFKYKIDFKRNGKSFDEVGDLLVAIPNDILGTQAFYNILENIIRNTAKHSQNKEDITVFTVNFINDINETEYKDCENKEEISNILNEFIAVEVYDNVDVKYENKKNENPAQVQRKEYKYATGKELSDKIDWLVYIQNKKLNEDILHDNKLRSSSLGLIEMDASAAYLRKRDVSFINHPSYQLNYDNSWSRLKTGKNCRHFLKAFNRKDISKSHLGYRFFLHRPAVVLAITKIRPENINELKKQGVWVTTPDYFKTYLAEGKVTNHDFMVYTENEDDKLKISELISTHKTFLPVRELKVSDDDMKGFLKKKSLEEFEEFCWEKWKGEKYNIPDIDIVNSFDKDCTTVFQAVFLDHLYSKDGNIKVKTEVETEWGKHKNADYVEALSSLGQSKMPDFYKLTDSSRCKEHVSTEKFKNYYLSNLSELVKHKIKEAVMTKVIVIDERIQEAAENNNFMGVSYKELYAKMGLVVPDKKKINLSENSFSKDFVNKTLKPFISEQIKDAKRTDFILIHYSILERMFIKEDINTYIEEELANNEINVVITSGRGIPDKLSEKVRFVNLSSVITSFIDIRSKYAINYLLNSTRKSNNI